MFARLWRSGVDERRRAEYERFARERSLPMFAAHDGFLGVLFLGAAQDSVTVLTLWESEDAIQQLEESSVYRQTVTDIEPLLCGSQTVEILHLEGARIHADRLETLLQRCE
jgi:heme-degrading monooxygenase HmoA